MTAAPMPWESFVKGPKGEEIIFDPTVRQVCMPTYWLLQILKSKGFIFLYKQKCLTQVPTAGERSRYWSAPEKLLH